MAKRKKQMAWATIKWRPRTPSELCNALGIRTPVQHKRMYRITKKTCNGVIEGTLWQGRNSNKIMEELKNDLESSNPKWNIKFDWHNHIHLSSLRNRIATLLEMKYHNVRLCKDRTMIWGIEIQHPENDLDNKYEEIETKLIDIGIMPRHPTKCILSCQDMEIKKKKKKKEEKTED